MCIAVALKGMWPVLIGGIDATARIVASWSATLTDTNPNIGLAFVWGCFNFLGVIFCSGGVVLDYTLIN
jgi:hypothetical protein